jgi:hypothetical protein
MLLVWEPFPLDWQEKAHETLTIACPVNAVFKVIFFRRFESSLFFVFFPAV